MEAPVENDNSYSWREVYSTRHVEIEKFLFRRAAMTIAGKDGAHMPTQTTAHFGLLFFLSFLKNIIALKIILDKFVSKIKSQSEKVFEIFKNIFHKNRTKQTESAKKIKNDTPTRATRAQNLQQNFIFIF